MSSFKCHERMKIANVKLDLVGICNELKERYEASTAPDNHLQTIFEQECVLTSSDTPEGFFGFCKNEASANAPKSPELKGLPEDATLASNDMPVFSKQEEKRVK